MKVPNGNADGKLFCIKRDVMNLEMLPRNPPVPISNNVLIIISRNALIYRIKNYYLPGLRISVYFAAALTAFSEKASL